MGCCQTKQIYDHKIHPTEPSNSNMYKRRIKVLVDASPIHAMYERRGSYRVVGSQYDSMTYDQTRMIDVLDRTAGWSVVANKNEC